MEHVITQVPQIFTLSSILTFLCESAEVEGKVLEGVSLAGLGACQLQWDELTNRGIQFLSAPKQVRRLLLGPQGASFVWVMQFCWLCSSFA